MNWDLFWVHKDTLAAQGFKGFSVFSLPHLLWLLFCLALLVLYVVFYRRSGEHRRDNMRKGLALFLILFEFFKLCVIVLTCAPIISYLPLHICSFAIYSILIDALWPQTRIIKQLMAFMFLPAAVVSLLFPTVTGYPPINFYPIHQFLDHTAIAAYIIAEYAAGEVRPRYAGLWTSLLVTALLAALIYPVNNAFQTNYLFLVRHSNNPALKLVWNVTGGTGGIPYILGLGVLIIVVMHIMFAVYAVLNRGSGDKT